MIIFYNLCPYNLSIDLGGFLIRMGFLGQVINCFLLNVRRFSFVTCFGRILVGGSSGVVGLLVWIITFLGFFVYILFFLM